MRAPGMAEDGMAYPSVFVVDSHAGYPLPPVPSRRRGSSVQWALYLLVSLALSGILVEACFIYHLYTSRAPTDSGNMEKSVQDRPKDEIQPTQRSNPALKPSKPTAHLSAGDKRPLSDGTILWNPEGDSVLHELEYREGGLVVQKEGYYFVYSKVFFTEPPCSTFNHMVLRRTPRYPEDIELMRSKRSHCQQKKELLNSYLGGVFHLFKGDALLVKAQNHTLMSRQSSSDNFFGAYMI
ncbi:hypothetical protein AGOR_G00225340 [Albula goreensis]|uniref:THD domain-containing protein n=1 Tax=Albula goreensis TaxID=1534307 RepID=A0A8T3CH00_9TELE|nr:hypothetical protein AGOR_G00225340 [Albula goreensis]